MSPEIWFFFTPDGSSEITVLNRDSARQVALLMSSAQRQMWKVRKNRWPEAMIVADCEEIYSPDGLMAAQTKAPAFQVESNDETLLHEIVPVKETKPELRLETQRPAAAPLKPFVSSSPAPVRKATQPVHSFASAANRTSAPIRTGESPRAQVTRNPQAAQAAPQANRAYALPTLSKSEKRRFPRFDLRLRVVVISGNRSFRSFSRNISHGGLLLEHVIPTEFLDRPCRVIIGSTDLKENIEFDARLAGDAQNPRAMEFFEGQEFFIKKLDSWIESMKKSATGARVAS